MDEYVKFLIRKSCAIVELRQRGESDSLTKTKHSASVYYWNTECEFCPVLWMSMWGDSYKRGLTAGVTMTLST